ncbi:hypothetical protein PQR71_32350 [Paraburkholderia fungorum]
MQQSVCLAALSADDVGQETGSMRLLPAAIYRTWTNDQLAY